MEIKFVADSATPNGPALLKELAKQLRQLDIGEVGDGKEPPPQGTLSPDPVTVIVTLQVIYWTAKAARALYKLVKEVREKHAVDNKVDPSAVPPLEIVAEEVKAQLSVPASKRKLDRFVETTGATDEGK